MSVVLHYATKPLIRPGRASLAFSTRAILRPTLRFSSFLSVGDNSKSTDGEIAPKVESPFIRRADRPANRPGLYHVKRPGDAQIWRSNRLCPTRDLNYTPEMWAKHKEPGRHIRHLFGVLTCGSIQRLVFPDLFLTATVASGLTYYNMFVSAAEPFSFNATAFTSASMAISVLAGFRLNSSYDRFAEARRIWGQINNTSRDLMGQACMFLNDQNKTRMKKLIKAQAVALHFHLNVKGGYFKLSSFDPLLKEKVTAGFRDEMREIFFPPDEEIDENNGDVDADYEIICQEYENGAHVPLLVLAFMRKTIIENEPRIDPRYIVDMDDQISNLTNCLGGCERILRTPIPTTYSRNTSRLLSLWSLSLPFGLYSMTVEWTLPISVLLSYVVLSLEDIGVEIEEPFHILPIRQYTEGSADSIDGIEKAYDLCPRGFKPVNSIHDQHNGSFKE